MFLQVILAIIYLELFKALGFYKWNIGSICQIYRAVGHEIKALLRPLSLEDDWMSFFVYHKGYTKKKKKRFELKRKSFSTNVRYRRWSLGRIDSKTGKKSIYLYRFNTKKV